MMKKKGYLTCLAFLTALTLLGGCASEGSRDNAGQSSGNESSGQVQERKAGASFQISEDDVTAVLSVDKESYEAGEEIHYQIALLNEREGWVLNKGNISYTLSGGLGAASEGSVPTQIDGAGYGETSEVSGILVGGESAIAVPKNNAKNTTANVENLKLRPYVKVTYGGEEVIIRAVIDMAMRQDIVQIPTEKRAVPKTATVHDPSIFKDSDGKYYVFGSFLATATSDDLFAWTNIDGKVQGSFTQEEIGKIRAWDEAYTSGNWNGNLWAPDVIYNPNLGKYCMYLSANGDDWHSNIVFLVADTVTGPYTYVDSIVYGGFNREDYMQTDIAKVIPEEIAANSGLPSRYITNGVDNRKWGDEYPNCIDPCVFFDDEGTLWMSYGSWSGGIFLLKLDAQTGLRDYSVKYETNAHSDAYFGKKIAGGKYVSGEASYIQKIGNYYWLFISYGGLEAKSGYNVRVFRSDRPDGDYVDALGNTPFFDKYSQNFNQSVGVRLFGGYKWRTMKVGQVAQGHNSAFVDDDGRAYMVFHTRTTDGTEGHYVKVHQLFMNKEGWLVAAPYRTHGESLQEKGIEMSEIAGEYEVILHELDLDYANLNTNGPFFITLNEDGSVTSRKAGEVIIRGSWSEEDGTAYMELTLDDVHYSGVVLKMDVEGSSIETIVFTVLGKENQLTLWGSKKLSAE